MTPIVCLQGLGGRQEPVSNVVDTHLLVPASGGHTWLMTAPYSSCDLSTFRKTRNSRHIAAKMQ